MGSWLKLVGTTEMPMEEHWVQKRSDLLREVRFSELHPPDHIGDDDRLVYHAVGDARMIALVKPAGKPRRDPSPPPWEAQWPIVLPVRVLLKVGRVSQGPATNLLTGLPDLKHQGLVALTPDQLAQAEQLLRDAGAR